MVVGANEGGVTTCLETGGGNADGILEIGFDVGLLTAGISGPILVLVIVDTFVRRLMYRMKYATANTKKRMMTKVKRR